MADVGVTMPTMADKGNKAGRKPGRPKGRTPTYALFARIPPELGERLERYIERTRPTPKRTAVVTLALERFLDAEEEGP